MLNAILFGVPSLNAASPISLPSPPPPHRTPRLLSYNWSVNYFSVKVDATVKVRSRTGQVHYIGPQLKVKE